MKKKVHNLQAALRLVAGLLFVFMVMNTTVANASPPAAPWDGQPADKLENAADHDGKSIDKPILIANAAELAYFANQVNYGGKKLLVNQGTGIGDADKVNNFTGYFFALSADIDLNGQTWTPIGNSNSFNGHFDGRGHTVEKLVVKEEKTNVGDPACAGLFGYVQDGTIQNLGVSLGDDGITATTTSGYSKAYAGGIVGRLNGTTTNAVIHNCYVTRSGTGGITAKGTEVNAGGIVGYAAGDPGKVTVTVTHCYATVDVIAEAMNSQCYAGGITGFFVTGSLTYTYATGKVKVKGGSPQGAGGICGYGDGYGGGQIANNLALNPEVTVTSGSDCHRILGYNYLKHPFTLSANYTNPAMKLTALPATDPAADNLDGASTWADKIQENLDAEWKRNNWTWTNTDQLPQLKVVNTDASGAVTGYEGWPGQPALPISDYLKPKLTSSVIENAVGHDGSTAEKAILIATADELAYFARQVNAGGTTLDVNQGTGIAQADNIENFAGRFFALSADIDLNGEKWIPIGNSESFNGYFDGRGHTVDKLVVKEEKKNNNDPACAGLFGYVQDGTIQNLGVSLGDGGITATATGDNSGAYAGGIVGKFRVITANVVIRNCYVTQSGTGGITAKGFAVNAGGIVGYAASDPGMGTVTVTHCYATVDVIAEATNGQCYVGGITGLFATGSLTYTYATGKVVVNGGSPQGAGGICGYSDGYGGGQIANNLALNSEVTVTNGSDCHRILGYTPPSDPFTLSANYANPAMKVHGDPVTDADKDPGKDMNGASTWLSTFKKDLTSNPADNNGWNAAWSWPDESDPAHQYELPKLYKTTADGKGFTTELIAGQTDRNAADYLPIGAWADMAKDVKTIKNTGGGNGKTIGSPILIETAEELAYFAQQVNEGGKELSVKGINDQNKIDETGTQDYPGGFSGYYFALSADIDLMGGDWTPIGNSNLTSFQGHFDGRGHTVNGVKVEVKKTGDNTVFAGLFGFVKNGTLQNLGVTLADAGIKASSENENAYAGGIVGWIAGFNGNATLRNCYVTGKGIVEAISTNSNAFAGGIAGGIALGNNNSATLTHCYATVHVTATIDANKPNTYYQACAGGIAGYSDGTLSYCYVTGEVTIKGGGDQDAGGISGQAAGQLTNCLALNPAISVAVGSDCHRIAGNDYGVTTISNYANPAMTLTPGGQPVTQIDAASLDGADTWLNLFRSDLTNASAADEGWNSGNWLWPAAPASTLLPKLAVVTTDADGNDTGHYDTWPGLPAQPDLDAADYGLLPAPQLHIVQPADGSGTLTVTDAADLQGTPLDDGIPVRPGTTLKLSATPGSQYDFAAFLAGDAQATLSDHAAATIVMPSADLWLSARFNAQTPPPPPEPVYYTVTLPAVEGAATDPAPGNYAVKAWKNFSFYLTLDAAYDQSKPVVTTSNGETLVPRSSDGAYLVKSIRNDVQIFIDGIVPNDPTANAAIESGIRVWASDGRLCLRTDRAEDVRIYTFAGELRRSFRSAGGDQTVSLAPGSYIVRIGDSSFKIIL